MNLSYHNQSVVQMKVNFGSIIG